MAREYTVKRPLIKMGGSVVVTLPKIWCDAESLAAGDEVLLKFDDHRELRLVPVWESPNQK